MAGGGPSENPFLIGRLKPGTLYTCRINELWKTFGGVVPEKQTTALSGVSHWDTDELLILLSDPFRRHILRSLASGPKPASEANGASKRNRPAYHRHFSQLCKAGIIRRKDNPRDRRKPLYYLDPRIGVANEDGILTLKFGRSMMRVRI